MTLLEQPKKKCHWCLQTPQLRLRTEKNNLFFSSLPLEVFGRLVGRSPPLLKAMAGEQTHQEAVVMEAECVRERIQGKKERILTFMIMRSAKSGLKQTINNYRNTPKKR